MKLIQRTLYFALVGSILVTSIQPLSSQAATSGDLLEYYGRKMTRSLEEEESRLDKYKKKYQQQLTDVNSTKMLNVVKEAFVKQKLETIQELEKEIVELEEELSNLVQQIEDNKESPVEELLKLDILYKQVKTQLDHKKEYLTALHQVEENTDQELITRRELAVLRDSKKAMESQKKRVHIAKSYVEIGDINNLSHPLDNEYGINSPYGERISPITGETEYHNALDFYAEENTPVLASFNGKVKVATYDIDLGFYIILDHGNGITTKYGHLAELAVDVGQEVNQYDRIAYSGNTGRMSTGPHLHYGLYINGIPQNPTSLFNK